MTTATRNGHKPDFLTHANEAKSAAERATLGGLAFDLSGLGRHRDIEPEWFDDPQHRAVYVALYAYRRSHPSATQCGPSALIQYVSTTPELTAPFSDANGASLDDIQGIVANGYFDADLLESNVAVLREAAFHGERRELLSRIERLPRDRFIREAGDWLDSLRASVATEYRAVTAQELATNDYPLNYMIPGLLVEGQPGVIGGGKKSLKTTLLVDLALSLASGSRFLGEFYVTRRYRVGLMSGESGAATIKETAERIAKSKSWFNLTDYTDLVFCFELPKLGKPDTAANLIKFIKSHALEVLCIDPLYLAMQAGDGASNIYSMGDKLAPLAEVIAETCCTILLAHHTRRTTKADFTRFAPPELDDLAFAGISEWVRQWLLLNRREEYNPENGGHHELWLASGGSAGHSGLWALAIDEGTRQTPGGRFWQVSVSKASDARQEAAQERENAKAARELEHQQRDDDKLLETYGKYPRGETSSYMAEAAGMNTKRFRQANSRLLAGGKIIPCRVQKGSKNYDGFRLKTAESDESDESDEKLCPSDCRSEGVSPTTTLSPLGESLSESVSLLTETDYNSENQANEIRRTAPEDDTSNLTPAGQRKPRRKKTKDVCIKCGAGVPSSEVGLKDESGCICKTCYGNLTSEIFGSARKARKSQA